MYAERIAALTLREMREWLADAFCDDLPEDLTDAEVIAGIKRHYLGGLQAFIDAM